jgi:hypothetical protein
MLPTPVVSLTAIHVVILATKVIGGMNAGSALL